MKKIITIVILLILLVSCKKEEEKSKLEVYWSVKYGSYELTLNNQVILTNNGYLYDEMLNQYYVLEFNKDDKFEFVIYLATPSGGQHYHEINMLLNGNQIKYHKGNGFYVISYKN